MSESPRSNDFQYDRKQLRWNGWGAVGEDFPFGEREAAIWQWIEDVLGGEPLKAHPPRSLEDFSLPKSRLSKAQLRKLAAVVGEDQLHIDHYERLFHAVGRSFQDVLRLRYGGIERAPDAVAYPANHDEVQELLYLCQKLGIIVIPFGGGSSVVGGVEAPANAERPVLTLDTTRMRHVLEIDTCAQTATVQTGIYGPDLEHALQPEGYTLGHYPQSFRYSTLGGWIAARSSGQQSNGYGNAARWLVAARMATPQGEVRTQTFPNSATGADLNQWIAGSEGTLGVITEATIRLTELPARRDYQGVLFPSFEAGATAIRRLVQGGVPMSMMRLSDADETKFFTAFGEAGKPVSPMRERINNLLEGRGYGDDKALMLLGVEGGATHTRWTMARALRVCVAEGGIPLGKGMGDKWYGGRFDMPYLREPMLDRGIGVETLETSTAWSNLHALHTRVQHAIRDAVADFSQNPCLVMGHISHSYPVGASLYFTFVWRMTPGDELAQWRRIKAAASQAIVDGGGTISHHHGVEADHLPWLRQEKSALSFEALRAAQAAVDPQATMNPGKLLPPKEEN